MKTMITKLMRPAVLNAVAGVVQAVTVLGFAAGWIDKDLTVPIMGLYAALAMLASAWYSPAMRFGAEHDFPRWTEEDAAA